MPFQIRETPEQGAKTGYDSLVKAVAETGTCSKQGSMTLAILEHQITVTGH
jgi:hypothetical protein